MRKDCLLEIPLGCGADCVHRERDAAITTSSTSEGKGATLSTRFKTEEARQLRAQVLEPKRAGFKSQLGHLPAV